MGKLKETISDLEYEAIEKMPDSRKVSDELINDFISPKGAFYHFYEKTKEVKELVVCFRGNGNPEKITIYYNNHLIWDLCRSVNKNKQVTHSVSINYDHARYYKNYNTKLGTLEKLGFNCKDAKLRPTYENKDGSKRCNGIGFAKLFVCKKESYSKEFVDTTYEIMKSVADTYFDISGKNETDIDHFREFWKAKEKKTEEDKVVIPPNNNGKNPYVEKRWQTSLFRYFKNTHDGLYVYDLEFSQPFPNSDYIKALNKEEPINRFLSITAKDIKDRAKDLINEPDMLAIRYKNSVPVALVLVEVKSTKNACTGTSGVFKHLKGMKSYSEEEVFMHRRRVEAQKILEDYKKLGICDNMADTNICDSLPIERLLILTDNRVPEIEYSDEDKKLDKYQSAIDYYSKVKSSINKKAKMYNCEIWLIHNRYDQLDNMKIESVDLSNVIITESDLRKEGLIS